MGVKKDLYLSWNEQGILQDQLALISMLVKAGISDKEIARYYKITLKEYKELKKNHEDLQYATDVDNIIELVNCFISLRKVAHGYVKKVPRKVAYKNKKGEDKYCIQEQDVYYQPNPSSVEYILDKFFGTQWRKDSEQLKIAKKKIEERKEEWENGN